MLSKLDPNVSETGESVSGSKESKKENENLVTVSKTVFLFLVTYNLIITEDEYLTKFEPNSNGTYTVKSNYKTS